MLCYAAHTTHVNQGLDVVVFAVLKVCWREERDTWAREKHQKVSKENFLEIYARTWIRVVTPEVIKAAFAKTGVWPVNHAAIAPEDMALSRETAHWGALPFIPPTPAHIIANAMATSRSTGPHLPTPTRDSSIHPTEPEYHKDMYCLRPGLHGLP